MTWTLDAANTGATELDDNASFTFAHTCGSLTNGILFVWVVWTTTTETITAVTYNGVAMTQAVHHAANRGVDIWYLINPASGSHNVVITGSGVLGRICAGSHSWSGAGAVQAPTTQTGDGTSANPSITCATNSRQLVVDCIGVSYGAGDTLTADANQTERGKINGNVTRGASSSQLGSDGGVMSWTDSISRPWSMAAAAFDSEVAVYVLPLHAHATDTLLHAEPTAGERNTLYILAELSDETGAILVDETGTVLVAFGQVGAIVLHAGPTDTLLHAEDV